VRPYRAHDSTRLVMVILAHMFSWHVGYKWPFRFGTAEESGPTPPDKPARGHREISYRLVRPSNQRFTTGILTAQPLYKDARGPLCGMKSRYAT
jgi:hypothetical protein